MTYYISLVESSVVLNKQDHQEIVKRWHQYFKPENNTSKIQRNKTVVHFSNSVVKYKGLNNYSNEFNSPEQFLDSLGFKYKILPNHDILITSCFHKEMKYLPHFFETIIDLIEPGSKLLWQGQDFTKFYWNFTGKKIEEREYKGYHRIEKQIEKDKEFEVLAEELKDFFEAPKEEKAKEIIIKEKPNRYKHML